MEFELSEVINLQEVANDINIQNDCHYCESYDYPNKCQSNDDCEVY